MSDVCQTGSKKLAERIKAFFVERGQAFAFDEKRGEFEGELSEMPACKIKAVKFVVRVADDSVSICCRLNLFVSSGVEEMVREYLVGANMRIRKTRQRRMRRDLFAVDRATGEICYRDIIPVDAGWRGDEALSDAIYDVVHSIFKYGDGLVDVMQRQKTVNEALDEAYYHRSF